MQVITFGSSPLLSSRLAKALEAELIGIERKKFPDGEIYVRIEGKPEEVVVVQNTYPNEELIACLIGLQALKSEGAREVTLIIPYYGYGRQDRKFLPGEGVSAEALAKALSIYADRVILIDPHKDYLKDFFDVECQVIHADEALVEMLFPKQVDFVASPDVGSVERAKRVARALGVPYFSFEKKRISATEVEMRPTEKLDLEGKSVGIVDDVISTGGTMIKAAEICLSMGASEVYAACIHEIFARNALYRMHMAGISEVMATDTIEGPASRSSVSGIIAKKLKGL